MLGQHQIPQEISSYEFRLVGNMTLKQFAKMAAGVIIAGIFYTSHLPGLFRFLLTLISLAIAAALAFAPINGRPLEVWFFIFLRRIYSPTIFLWKKMPAEANLDVLARQAHRARFFQKVAVGTQSETAREFLASLPQQAPPPSSPPPPPPSLKKATPAPAATPQPATTAAKVPPGDQPTKPAASEPDWQELAQLWKTQKPQKATPAQFVDQKLPATPTQPNIVSGLVVDNDGNTIEGAIVEIQDAEGNPVRAMRTNGLGQFQTATPLPNGSYLVITEKEPYQFDIMKINVNGQIIAPLKIVARAIKN